MPRPLTIVVGGYIVGYPLGGMTWHHLNYLLGLHDMGHEVWFLEDSGSYSYPFDPRTWTNDVTATYGLKYLRETFQRYGFPAGRFCYYSEFTDTHHGLSRDELHDLLARTDLMICVSGVTPLREDQPRPKRTVVIDTDPVFTQLRMRHDTIFAGYYRSFDCVATFGRLIGTPGCPLPTHGLDWIPTNQPIALRHWPVAPTRSRVFSTLGKWEHSIERSFEFGGQSYASSKGPGWYRVIDLPARVPWELTLGMSSMPEDVKAQFAAKGWRFIHPEKTSESPEAFQQFIRDSAGEFTVAKEIYSGLPSGWFSDRAADYLASGRPVVTQASGFDRWLPVGEGLFSYSTPEQAAAALNTIASNYSTHAAAARRVAEKYFDAKIVLQNLIDRVMVD